jgi:lipopolysaccharide/colanic/teichoic acid biosynthesis glycosyltransferase
MSTSGIIRIFDIVLAAGALIVLSPLLLGAALVLRLTGEGEIFYIQQRVGRSGKLFGIVKFATMLKNSPGMASGEITIHNDPRVLPVGRFLRKYKINELPQLWNILIGDMSVIGPRPQTKRCFAAFPKEAHAALTSVRPGLSSIGSILFRDEEIMSRDAADPIHQYNHVIMPYKAAAELAYIGRPSLSYYFQAIAVTVWVVLRPRSRAALKAFPNLPPPPPELARYF